MHNINKPIDKINIGYNKSNEEYIGLMNEKNKIKREMEKSREHQDRMRTKEREAGFNVHINGANEERIKEQRRQELLRGNSRGTRSDSNQQQLQQQQDYEYNIGVGASQNMLNQKIRRVWKNPNSDQQPENSNEQKYTNPFDLGAQTDKKQKPVPMPITGQQSPPRLRKRWGKQNDAAGLQGVGGAGKPTKAIHDYDQRRRGDDQNDQDEYEDYSDSFEDDNNVDDIDDTRGKTLKREDLSGIQDNYGDSGDEDDHKAYNLNENRSYADKFNKIMQQEQEEQQHQEVEEEDDNEEQVEDRGGKNDIENFLKTATMNDINALRQSLSNFAELSKQFNPKKDTRLKVDDEDYIEEEFEEQIESDEEADDSDEEERKENERLEKMRQEQLRQQQQLKTQQTTRGAKNRPISAVYSLEPTKIQTQRTQQPTQVDQYNSGKSQASLYDPATVQSIHNNIFFGGNNKQELNNNQVSIQETPKQPNDNMKKPVNTNPFKRPFSQNVPKRPENNLQPSQEQLKGETQPILSQIQENPDESQLMSNKKQQQLQESQSTKVAPPINQILQKIELLDDWQREKLMEILDNFQSLTSSMASQTSNRLKDSALVKNKPPGQQQQQQQQVVQNLDLKFLSPPKQTQKSAQLTNQVSAFSNSNKKEIVLKVKKTYGNPHLCGLTEIELFDENAKKITLAPAHIFPRNIGQGPKIPVSRLCDGFKLTNEEKHMWIGYLPMHPQSLELVIQVDKKQEIGGLKIWNYNKSAFDCTKGVKEMQISIDGELVWEGLIESGKGSTTTEYATFIQLKDNITLPSELKPKPVAVISQEPIEEAYEEEESKDWIKQSELKTVKKDEHGSGEKEDFMKKYRSEAILKQQLRYDDKTLNSAAGNNSGAPIWLSGSQQSQRNIDQLQSNKSKGSFPQSQQQRQRDTLNNNPTANTQDNKDAFKTYDLLDKYQFNSSQQQQQQQLNKQNNDSNSSGSHHNKNNSVSGSTNISSQGSQRQQQLNREQNNNLGGISTKILPNAGPAQQVQSTKSGRGAQVDINQGMSSANLQNSNNPIPQSQNNTKQWTQPFAPSQQNSKNSIFPSGIGQALQETSDAIQKAVSKVNQVMNNQQQKNKPQVVEESLDNLDFFKATNRGRLMNFNEQKEDENQVKQAIEKTTGGAQGRKQWGVSPGKGGSNNSSRLQDSQMSGSKQHSQHKAHVVVKNPFPGSNANEALGSSGPKSTQRNKSIKEQNQQLQQQQDRDYLDQFLSNNINSNQNSNNLMKQQQQPFNYQVNSQQQQKKDQIHHLQFAGQGQNQFKPAQKQSISPPRDQSSHLYGRYQIPTQQNNESSKIQFPSQLNYEEKLMEFSKPFMIPNLPSGSKLEFNILQTWGDMNYVGLSGIEVYDIEGKQIQILPDQISACPPDINILPGYGGDPRTVDKLVDGNYLTTDDCHVWLTPFTAGEDHTITIELGGVSQSKVQISMIRIWNYNKSRIHSYRGARLVDCTLDGQLIFRGEIQKAPGNMNDPENCCEIIMFTDNESIMQRIDFNDWINEQVMVKSDLQNTQRILMQERVPGLNEERPMTATKKFSTAEIQELQRQLRQQKPTSLFDERPQTSAIISSDQEESKKKPSSQRDRFEMKHQELSNQVRQIAGISQPIKGRLLEINILESWGDLFYVGLTGIEVWDENGNPINITKQMLDAEPRDMNSIPGYGSDYRTLDKLINRVNNTMDDHNMWLIPYNKGENHILKIDLGKVSTISALKFYNYNKSDEDTLRGAKQITIQLDKKYLTPKKGLTLMKAPGVVHPLFDMGHLIKIPYKIGWTTEQMIPLQRPLGQLGLFQEYDLLSLPMGFQFRLNLYSTHGDFYYIGLNGLEFYDQKGDLLKIQKIFAEPEGVNKLPGMESDVRIVQNLINGKNQSQDEINMWLAPFKNTRSYQAVTNSQQQQQQQSQVNKQTGKAEEESSGQLEYRIPNYVCVVFEQPTAISAIRLWNYTKTPARGVNEFEILVDDKQAYRGFAKIAPEQNNQSNQDFSTVVLFTTDAPVVSRFQSLINCDPSKQQEVALINEKKQMNAKSNNQNKLRQASEEFVFSEMQRPTTMAKRSQY